MKQEKEINLNFDTINKQPYLNSTTSRKDTIFEKNGYQVCMSLDSTIYTNHYLYNTMEKDQMIEIEAMGDIKNRIMLNEIHDFISKNMNELDINRQSKYERGLIKTTQKFISSYEKHENEELNYTDDNVLVRLIERQMK